MRGQEALMGPEGRLSANYQKIAVEGVFDLTICDNSFLVFQFTFNISRCMLVHMGKGSPNMGGT